jgi:hypothetical protein
LRGGVTDETDKTSEKYYPKTLIIKIVQNHLLFLCIILLTLVFSDFADRIAGIRFVIAIDYPCNVTRSITPINSIKIIITSQAKHQSINQSINQSPTPLPINSTTSRIEQNNLPPLAKPTYTSSRHQTHHTY